MSEAKPWWGEFELNEEQKMCWSIHDRKIIIQRHTTEWNTWNIETAHENNDHLIEAHCVEDNILDESIMVRHLQNATTEKILIQPALADRSIVVRPSSALRILGGEKVQIYVSTPLWFQALIPSSNTCILDIPFWRPSDSWFGLSHIQGELCYAKYTDARFKLESLERRPHRATTAINIHNKDSQILSIERLNVPVSLLNIYADDSNTLWTNSIDVTRESDGNAVELHLGKSAPANVANATLVSRARITDSRHTLIRTISSLFA